MSRDCNGDSSASSSRSTRASSSSRSRSPRSRATAIRSALVAVLVGVLAFAAGCTELNARREIQDGNRHYENGDFDKAVASFEASIKKAPHIDVGHHNLGLAYYELYRRAAVGTPERKELGRKSADELGIYLAKNPSDNQIRMLMTRVWLDSDNFEQALVYWQKELEKDPANVEVLDMLAAIHRDAGHWDEMVIWLEKSAEATQEPKAKAESYVRIARLAWDKLADREKVVGADRIRIADTGIASLQKAQVLTPKSSEVESYLASMFELRSLAHGPSWAAGLDRASTQHHRLQWRVLKEAEDKLAPPQAAPASPVPAKSGG